MISEQQYELQHLAKIHAEEAEKDFRQILDDEDERNAEETQDTEDIVLNQLMEMGYPVENEDDEFIEQR